MSKGRYSIDGKVWLSTGAAAKLLGTNGQGIRNLIATGRLPWCQSGANSLIFLVDEQAVVTLCAERPRRKLKRSPDPLARSRRDPFPPSSGSPARGGGIFDEHRIRMTLAPGGAEPPVAAGPKDENEPDPDRV